VTAAPTTEEQGRTRTRDLARAAVLVDRAGLDLRPGVTTTQAVALVARVLHYCDPLASVHGRLLVAALHGRPRTERTARPRRPSRSPAEHAVRRLLASGQAPTPAAVAAVVERAAQRDRTRAALVARLTPIATRDGPVAARLVADHWREHGRQFPPAQLGKQLGWRSYDVWAVIHLLVEAGWLAIHHGKLQPGPRARQSHRRRRRRARRQREDVLLPGRPGPAA
jgi:hypothetical protein